MLIRRDILILVEGRFSQGVIFFHASSLYTQRVCPDATATNVAVLAVTHFDAVASGHETTSESK
jgi:hypothetical protein